MMMTPAEESEHRVRLAEQRTLLAEKRTILSELQVSILLVTLPLTLHTGVIVLASSHEIAARLHVLVPFWILLGTMVIAGLALMIHAIKGLRRVNHEIQKRVHQQVHRAPGPECAEQRREEPSGH
jgi:uncharacterized membrane protein YidH (DUF202 family)